MSNVQLHVWGRSSWKPIQKALPFARYRQKRPSRAKSRLSDCNLSLIHGTTRKKRSTANVNYATDFQRYANTPHHPIKSERAQRSTQGKKGNKNPTWWPHTSKAAVAKGVLDKVCFKWGDGKIYIHVMVGLKKKIINVCQKSYSRLKRKKKKQHFKIIRFPAVGVSEVPSVQW